MSDYAITPEPEPEDQGEALNRTASAVAPAPSETSQRTGLARLIKPRLDATGTMNLSTVSDTGSAFGLTSSRPSEMNPDHNENDRARARRTELTATSRKLGLAPTEMDLDPVASASKPRSMSDSTRVSSPTGTMPIRTDAGPAHLPSEVATRSTSAAIGDMGPPRPVPERGTSETSAEPEGWAKRAARTGVPEPSKVPAYNVG
jgi:hypothetical protein